MFYAYTQKKHVKINYLFHYTFLTRPDVVRLPGGGFAGMGHELEKNGNSYAVGNGPL